MTFEDQERAATPTLNPNQGTPRRRPAKQDPKPSSSAPDDNHRAEKSARGRGGQELDATHRTTAAPANIIDAASPEVLTKRAARHHGEGHIALGTQKGHALANPSDAANRGPHPGGGRMPCATHDRTASPAPISDGQCTRETHGASAVGGDQAMTLAKPKTEVPDRKSLPAMAGDETSCVLEPITQASRRKVEVPSNKRGRQARRVVQPISSPPDGVNPAQAGGIDHSDSVTQFGGVDASDQANTPPNPNNPAPDRTHSGAAGRDGAMAPLQPKQRAPRHELLLTDGHSSGESQNAIAVAGDQGAQRHSEPQSVSSPLIAEIIQLVRMRRRWIKAKNALVLQGKALCRGWTEGDKDEANKLYDKAESGDATDPMLAMALSPFFAALQPFLTDIKAIEKTLTKLGAQLPVWKSWGQGVKGLSSCGLSIIVGECGDIGSYRNPSCVWKRMGLAVHSGHRQGNPGDGATADDWTFEAYSKVRRSVMWNIGNGLIGGMGKFRPLFGEDVEANDAYSPYQKLFAARLRVEAARLPHKDGTAIKESETGKESYTLHAANRAKRYVEKRMLRDLYAAWRLIDSVKEDTPQ